MVVAPNAATPRSRATVSSGKGRLQTLCVCASHHHAITSIPNTHSQSAFSASAILFSFFGRCTLGAVCQAL